MAKRFFSESSYWNQPIGADDVADPRSEEFIGLLKQEEHGSFGINIHRWTVPIFEVDDSVPRIEVGHRSHSEQDLAERESKWVGFGDRFGHQADFDSLKVPVPPRAVADPAGDAHLAIVDFTKMVAWDMWGVRRDMDGNVSSNTGMMYRLNGDGIFNTSDFDVKDGDSIHFYGPSRASGVPAIAGVIMHDEVAEGHIPHKLACATRYNAYKEFVFPACWTDGHLDGGLPEGAVVRLDPALDLRQFRLTAGERVVARAFQEYGAVNVDNASGSTLYAEGLWAKPGKSWDGILTATGLMTIPIEHYQVMKLGEITHMGEGRRSGLGH